MRIAVVTATVGATDALREPALAAPDIRYYCGSDRPVESDVWRRVDVDAGQDAALAARQFKARWIPPQADAWLWIDAHYRLEVDPRILLPYLLRFDIAALRHPWAPTIDAEAAEISRRGLAPEGILRKQVSHYRQAGFRESSHSSTGFLLRRADARTLAFGKFWSAETKRWGHSRDQMSFDYCAWKTGLSVGYLEGEYRANPYATWQLEEAA